MPLLTIERSLLTENPERQKEHAHITHVRGGQRVRAKHHRGDGDYTHEDWLSDVKDKLKEAAWEAQDHGTEDFDPVAWLDDRGIRLPDSEDIATRRTVNQWLTTYGPTAFALGIHLKDAGGTTIATQDELPKLERALVFDLGKAARQKPRGHVSYVRWDPRAHKLVRVQAKGSITREEVSRKNAIAQMDRVKAMGHFKAVEWWHDPMLEDFVEEGVYEEHRLYDTAAFMYGILAKNLEGIQLALEIPEDHGCKVEVKVRDDWRRDEPALRAAAFYSPDENKITIDPDVGKHSFVHEFGHMLDFKVLLGKHLKKHEFGYLSSRDLMDRLSEGPIPKHLKDFDVQAEHAKYLHRHYDELSRVLEKTGVVHFALWYKALERSGAVYRMARQDIKEGRRQKKYWSTPVEMFANYFDQWVQTRIKEKGQDPAMYRMRPDERSWLPDKEFNAVREHFEEFLASNMRLIKSLFLDLAKARRRGDLGAIGKRAKRGAVVFVGGDTTGLPSTFNEHGVAYPRKGQNAAQMAANYQSRGINCRAILPGQVAAANMVLKEHRRLTARGEEDPARFQEELDRVLALEEQKKILDRRKESVELPEEVVAELEAKRGVEETTHVDFLHQRVSAWKPPRKKFEIDPAFAREWVQLEKRRREVARATPGKSVKQKMLANPDYESVVRRMQQIRASGYVPQFEEGSKMAIAPGVHVMEGGGYLDLGFSATDYPMSYLLSVSTFPREKPTKLPHPVSGREVWARPYKLNPNEQEALLYEFSYPLSRGVSEVAQAYDLQGDDKDELKQRANELFLLFTASWEPDGDPSDTNNFRRYVFSKLSYGIQKIGKKMAEEKGREVHDEELEEMPISSHGTMMTPGVRVESPEMAAQRTELEEQFGKLVGSYLPPIMRTVVTSRLNFASPDKHPLGSIKEEGSGIGVKPWEQVKQDVLDYIKTRDDIPEQDRKNKANAFGKLKATDFERLYFHPAMDLISNTARDPYSPVTSLRTLAELASLKQLQLQGIRHAHWDPTESLLGVLNVVEEEGGKKRKVRLTVSPTAGDSKEITKLEAQLEAVKNKLKASTPSTDEKKLGKEFRKLVEIIQGTEPSEERKALKKQREKLTGKITKLRQKRIGKLMEKRQELRDKLHKLRGEQGLHAAYTQAKVSSPGSMESEGVGLTPHAEEFWTRDRAAGAIARQVGVDLDLLQLRRVRGVEIPAMAEQNRVRGEVMFAAIKKLRSKSAKALRKEYRARSAKVATEPPTIKVKSHSYKLKEDEYRALLEHVIHEKTPGAREKSSEQERMKMLMDRAARSDKDRKRISEIFEGERSPGREKGEALEHMRILLEHKAGKVAKGVSFVIPDYVTPWDALRSEHEVWSFNGY